MTSANRSALVTGAGGGIGAACSVALAGDGLKLYLMGRDEGRLAPVADEIRRRGGEAVPISCDVTDPQQVAEVVDGLGRVDVLVNSAGTNVPEPFVEVSPSTFDDLLRVNVSGTFFASQAVAKKMIAAGEGGSIINISSQMGHVGAANRSVYCTTKHAVEGLTKALAIELSAHDIRVNSVAPTYVKTPMTTPFFEDEEFLRDSLSRIPLGRLGEPGDVAAAVSYLASASASMITGTSLVIDGGYTAQ